MAFSTVISRRTFLRLFAGLVAAGAATSAYATIVEPFFRLRVTRYKLTPPKWPANLKLRLAVIADVHACLPWMSADRIKGIAAKTNALQADVILLLGDYVATHKFQIQENVARWSGALRDFRAPLGTHAVLGNHDWWSDPQAMVRLAGPTYIHKALGEAGIPVYENDARRFEKDGQPFWIAGLGDQIAFALRRGWEARSLGIDDLPGTLAKVSDDAPIILMAHEPDIFPDVPDRVALTISGHTHGGQVSLFGWRPIVPSFYGDRFAYGHIVEKNRHLIVSGGLGCSGIPVRFGSPPEIVVIDLGE